MIPPALAIEPRALAPLAARTKANDPEALRAVARQFESLFAGLLLKSMRAASQLNGDDPFENAQTRLYTELFDQQIASQLANSGRGLGLADLLVKQLAPRPAPVTVDPVGSPLAPPTIPRPIARDPAPLPRKSTLPRTDSAASAAPIFGRAAAPTASDAKRFVQTLWPHAVAAAQALGVAPHALVAQAALETGWGQREIRLPDGRSSHNVFGIKADGDWAGESVAVSTREVIRGRSQETVARFRVYGSYAEAFADYVRLIIEQPRYAAARAAPDAAAYADALARAGYATDPAYADKLKRVMKSALLREALA